VTRIDFYLLLDEQPDAADRYACTLSEEAYRSGQRVLLRCADEAHCARLDALLWSYRDSSFLPHGRLGQSSAPVLLWHPGTAATGAEPPCQLLINLSDSIATDFQRFRRVCEIICQAPAPMALARAHYRHYREHGCELQHHRLRQRILSHSV
jgi:DNA polymerase IIIc chi subunit